MGVAMDGAKLNIREEGWKEFKIGSLFDIAVRPTQESKTGELIDLAHAVNNSYVAHLGGPDVLGEMAWAEAQRRGWEEAASEYAQDRLGIFQQFGDNGEENHQYT